MALWYAPALSKMLGEEIDFANDDIHATLHTSAYTPDRVADEYVSDLTNELATGSGYTQGGELLTTKSVTTTGANAWATVWATGTPVDVGYVARPTTGNGFIYRVVAAGTTAGAEPTWPTVIGEDVVDNDVTWECVGSAIVVIDCDTISWASATFTARYCVISDRTPAAAGDQPLIALIDFGQDETGQGGTFDIVPDAQGLLHAFVA